MRVYVRLTLPNGDAVALGHGDFIGRLPSAALYLDDARISEAHALVSLRGQELKLLALRGRFAIGQKPVSEVVLRPGLRIQLARDLEIHVQDVVLPESVLAVSGDGLPSRVLRGTTSLVVRPRPQLIPRYQGDADAWFWSAGEGWRLRLAGGEPRLLKPGDAFEVAGLRFHANATALASAGQARTQVHGAVGAPFRLVSTYDTAHFHREGQPVLTVRGIPARMLGELVACGAPVSWKDVARVIWPRVEDDHQLRTKWDIALSRLRGKLRNGGVRPDIVRPDGTGNIELVLADGDVVEDRT